MLKLLYVWVVTMHSIAYTIKRYIRLQITEWLNVITFHWQLKRKKFLSTKNLAPIVNFSGSIFFLSKKWKYLRNNSVRRSWRPGYSRILVLALSDVVRFSKYSCDYLVINITIWNCRVFFIIFLFLSTYQVEICVKIRQS